MFQVDNPFVAAVKWLLIVYVLVSLIYALVSLILFLASVVIQKKTGVWFLQPQIGLQIKEPVAEGWLQRFQQCSTYMINPCFLMIGGLAYLAYLANSVLISFGWSSAEMGIAALINAPLIIFALFGSILFLGNIYTPKPISMGQGMQSCGNFIAQLCILIVVGLTYFANSAFISFGWLSAEMGTIILTIDLAIAALSIGLILLTIVIAP